MAIFKWLDTSEVDGFAKAIAEDLMGRLPLVVEGRQKPLTQERLHNAHQAIVARTASFGRTHKVNWFKKARLGNTFRWTLLEKGYDKPFVDTWTHNVLVALAAPSSPAGEK